MHGHDEAEETLKEKERLCCLINEGYVRRKEIPIKFQNIFILPLDKLIKNHSMPYLKGWVYKILGAFYAN